MYRCKYLHLWVLLLIGVVMVIAVRIRRIIVIIEVVIDKLIV